VAVKQRKRGSDKSLRWGGAVTTHMQAKKLLSDKYKEYSSLSRRR